MRVGSPLTVAGAAADSEARFGSFLTAFPFHPQACFRAGGEPEQRDYAESRRASQAPSGFDRQGGAVLSAAAALPLPLPFAGPPKLSLAASFG